MHIYIYIHTYISLSLYIYIYIINIYIYIWRPRRAAPKRRRPRSSRSSASRRGGCTARSGPWATGPPRELICDMFPAWHPREGISFSNKLILSYRIPDTQHNRMFSKDSTRTGNPIGGISSRTHIADLLS